MNRGRGIETYGSRRLADAPAIEVHAPGEVYARDDFVYWGFSAEGLRRLAQIVGLDEVEVVDELEIDGHPRILAVLRAAGRPHLAVAPLSALGVPPTRPRCRS